MKKRHRLLLYTLFLYVISVSIGLAKTPPAKHYCGFTGHKHDTRRFARIQKKLDFGEPRTVRMIYFLPTDREFRADVVQQMKNEIRTVQRFFADQMNSHGFGESTFQFETDAGGEPVVHRVDAEHPFSSYDFAGDSELYVELEGKFNFDENIYFIVLGADSLGTGAESSLGGLGLRHSKTGGSALVSSYFGWRLAAHELGHAFGLGHDFRDNKYIMSYGPNESELSACNAEYLAVHSYFNPEVPVEIGRYAMSEVISPLAYDPGVQSVPIRLSLRDFDDGLHEVLLFSYGALVACQGLGGVKERIVVFDYDGVIALVDDSIATSHQRLSDAPVHPLFVEVVDTSGNVEMSEFQLVEISPHHLDTLEGHTSPVRSLSFSPDGQILASGSSDPFDDAQSNVILWDVEARTNIRVIEDASHVVFSPDGFKYATGSPGGAIKLWDAAAHQTAVALENHTDAINALAFSADGAALASAARFEEAVTLWNTATGNVIDSLEGHTGSINALAFSLKDGLLASGGSGGEIKLWDITTGEDTDLIGHNDWVESIAFTPDGATLASGSFDRTVKLWDVAARQDTDTIVGHWDVVSAVTFSPDGATLATGSADGTVKLWDAETGLTFGLLPFTSEVTAVAFSPDGTLLATGTERSITLSDTSELMRSRIETTADVEIPDPNLREAIASALNKPPDTRILRGHLDGLRELFAFDAGISDLTGLELAANLVWLDLSGNELGDISALESLSNLTSLHLDGNAISDISALAELRNLTLLTLSLNSITDLAPLVSNVGIDDGDIVDVQDNPLSELSINAHIPALQERGVMVYHGESTPPLFFADVNFDGVVDIFDLVRVGLAFGEEGDGLIEDVNVDGVVDIEDLVFVASALGEVFAAPASKLRGNELLSAETVRQWIEDARKAGLTTPTSLRGIATLKRLLSMLTPKTTALLQNYPNPFNPETWIPYHLARAGEVTLTIYDAKGGLVRQLDLGHRDAGFYTDQTGAAHWDGRNQSGETVASGLYFYQLSTGDYSAARRMLILK